MANQFRKVIQKYDLEHMLYDPLQLDQPSKLGAEYVEIQHLSTSPEKPIEPDENLQMRKEYFARRALMQAAEVEDD